jgi:(S)-2-hydroxyglutarate dehydrogenase
MYDVAVVGAGILGLATARELLRRDPGASVVILEREDRIAAHQTGHNSGVIHAGIYYTPGSLKAQLCVAGARELYEFCDEHGVRYERCGKLIVAVDETELGRLDELERRAVANEVPGLRRLNASELHEIEPEVAGVAGLHSPNTGIVDFGDVARAYASDVTARGASIRTGVTVFRLSGSVLHTSAGEIEARRVVACAGAWSDRLAQASGESADPRIVPFRGGYMRLRESARHLVRGLIYPVPDPSLPFLGVHLTKRIDGEVLIGPSALLAPARDAYELLRLAPDDVLSTLTWPGTYRMARRFWRTGVDEMRHLLPGGSFVGAAARFVPELRSGDVTAGFAGVRAQAVGRDGRLVDDFVFSHTERALHVRNAPSPGATSSLAIARYIADEAQRTFDLPTTTSS